MGSTSTRRIIAAGMIGNILEWYDFAVYGYFAASIGSTFFSDQDKVAQLLSAFGIFAVGFLMRPLGGALVGHIGDSLGRRAALTISVAAMAIPTFLVGVLPGYQTLGIMAPVLLTLLRVIQGLSVGGEYTTSIVFMVERAPSARRGLIGAFACCGAVAGILLGSATGALLSSLLPEPAMVAWGWRIPFLLGLLVGVAGYILRRELKEAPQGKSQKSALGEAFRDHWGLLIRLSSLAAFNAVGFYLLFVYVVSWLQLADGIAPATALGVNTVSMIVLLPVVVLMGHLSDRFGRRPILLLSAALAFVGAIPLFALMYRHDTGLVLLGQLGFVAIVGMYMGTQPAAMVEAVPARVRCTAVALGYNVAFGILGGLTPLVATWLVRRTDNDLSPAMLIMAAAAISFLSILLFRESKDTPLEMAPAAA